jgi:hypothetical protein
MSLRKGPTPTIAPVLVCVVLTGFQRFGGKQKGRHAVTVTPCGLVG